MYYIIIITALAIVFLIAEYLAKKKSLSTQESSFFKNVQLIFGTSAVLVTGYFAYVKFIQEREEKEKLPAVLNIRCHLEKVGESDFCYWLKASLTYENKSERRINILFSSFYLRELNFLPLPKPLNPKSNLLPDKDSTYLRDFSYHKGNVLYSRKIESQNWHDFNELCNYDYIIAVPKGFNIISLVANVAIANNKRGDFPSCYKFTDSICTDGKFKLNIYYTDNNGTINITDSTNAPSYLTLEKEHGFCYTSSMYQLYLKDSTNTHPNAKP